MAPNGELFGSPFSRPTFTTTIKPQKAAANKISTAEGLQRAISDLSFQLSKEPIENIVESNLPPISEVEDAKCECCGMSEECTPEYISQVRDKFSGKWICGLCSEAVKEEMEKYGGKQEEALQAHMSSCVRFNRFGRTHPVLYQAEVMREMLRKSTRVPRAKSTSPRELKKGGIARSSSCIPSITKEMMEQAAAN